MKNSYFLIRSLAALRTTMSRPTFYAVANGRNPGIYTSWEACRIQVEKYSNAVYKKFSCPDKAEKFLEDKKASSSSSSHGVRKKDPTKRYSECSSDEDFDAPKRLYSTYGGYTFDTDSNGYVNVYTDGACTSNGFAGAKAGIGVFFRKRNPLNVSQPVIGRATNNVAEIQAVIVALLQAKKVNIKNIKVNTDSQFLISCMTDWMPNWKENGWRTSNGKEPINKKELIELENCMRDMNVVFNYVPAHSGIPGNEVADRLARQGAASYRG